MIQSLQVVFIMEIVLTFCFVLASNSVVGMTTWARPPGYDYDFHEVLNHHYECTDEYGNGYLGRDTLKPRPCKLCGCTVLAQLYCVDIICEPPACGYPMWLPDRCCPLCPGDPVSDQECRFGGKTYFERDQIEGCPACYCISGEVVCDYNYNSTMVEQEIPTCVTSGVCIDSYCPNGSNCAANNRTIVPAGQSLKLPNGYVCDCYEPSGGRCDRPAWLPDHVPVLRHDSYVPIYEFDTW